MKAQHSYKNYLEQFPHYSESAYQIAIPYLKTIKLKKGEYFIKEGKTCRRIAYIKEGLLRTFYLRDGYEITTCFCKENTIACSYKSLITQSPSELSIQALENCALVVINYTDLQELYTKHLFWQQVGRLAAENEFITAECYTRFLNDLSAKERYLQVLQNEPDLIQRVPLVHLASYLQIKPETLSRIRREISIS